MGAWNTVLTSANYMRVVYEKEVGRLRSNRREAVVLTDTRAKSVNMEKVGRLLRSLNMSNVKHVAVQACACTPGLTWINTIWLNAVIDSSCQLVIVN